MRVKLAIVVMFLATTFESSLEEDALDAHVSNQQSSTPQETVSCSSNHHGLNNMLTGVDVTKLVILGFDFRYPLIETTCTKNRTFKGQLLPLEVELVVSDPTNMGDAYGIVSNGPSVYHNLQDYRDNEFPYIFPGVDYLPGAFSTGANYREARATILEDRRKLAMFSQSIHKWSFQLRDSAHLDLHSIFLASINVLPSTYAQNVDAYRRFIEDYGTHYFGMGHFGGRLSAIETYKSSMKDNEIAKDVKNAFFRHFGNGGNDATVNATEMGSSEPLGRMLLSSFVTSGGDSGRIQQEPRGYPNWSASLDKGPSFLGGVLRPIEELVANKNIRTELKKAITFYRLKAYFDDYTTSYEMCGNKDRLSYQTTNDAYEQNVRQIQDVLNNADKYDQLETISDRITQLFKNLLNTEACQS